MSEGLVGPARSQALLDAAPDRKAVQAEIREAIETLYADGTPPGGALALAWQMLTVDPKRAYTFWSVLPQLTFALDAADLPADDDADLRRRLRIRWRAAEAEWPESEVSVFRIAAVESALLGFPCKDEERAGDAPLGGDKLANIGKPWARAGFSIRALKAIVRSMLQARDSCAMRH